MTDSPEYTEHRLKVARTARYGRIGTLGDATLGIWLVLHGYGELASKFAGSARWPSLGNTAIVFPEALQRFYLADASTPHVGAPVGASWMTREERLDDIADNNAYLDTLVVDLQARSPDAAIGLLGFSQGAATAARWAALRAAQGKPVRALVLWGALCPPDVDISQQSPLSATALTYVVGRRDRWITEKLVEAERQRLDSAGRPYHLHQFDGGHRLDDASLEAVLTSL